MAIDEEDLKDYLRDAAVDKIKSSLASDNLYIYSDLPKEEKTIANGIKNNLYKSAMFGLKLTPTPSFNPNYKLEFNRWNYFDINAINYGLGILHADKIIEEILDCSKDTILNLDKRKTFVLRKRLGVYENGQICPFAIIDRALNVGEKTAKRLYVKKIQ